MCGMMCIDMHGLRYANNLLKNPATKRHSGKMLASVCMLTKEEELPTILRVLPIIMQNMGIVSPQTSFPTCLRDAQSKEFVMCLLTTCTDCVDDGFFFTMFFLAYNTLGRTYSKDASCKYLFFTSSFHIELKKCDR